MAKTKIKPQKQISIVIPAYNVQTTIEDTLMSLWHQKINFNQCELLIINDGSRDSSLAIIEKVIRKKPKDLKIRITNKTKSEGLSAAYNTGIKQSTGQIVVTMHGDITLETDSLAKLIQPINQNSSVVATYCVSINPEDIWKEYSFWQKCLFARLVGRHKGGIDGKFNAFKKNALEKVGLFDQQTFYRAGEDIDMNIKLSKIGQIQKAHTAMYHIHDKDPQFSLKKLIYKHQQYANAQGAILKRYGITTPINFIASFYKELLFIFLFIPGINIIDGILVLIFVFLYTKEVYLREYKDVRILLLPLVNFSLLPISIFYSFKGFLDGKQTI